MKRKSLLLRIMSVVLVLLLTLTSVPIYFTASAVDNSDVPREGSAALIRNGGYRPYLEWYNQETYGLLRHQEIYVYVDEGETLMFGSSVATGCFNNGSTIGVVMPSSDGNINSSVTVDIKNAETTVNPEITSLSDRNLIYTFKPSDSDVTSQGYIANTTTEAKGPVYLYNDAEYNSGGYIPFTITVPKGCGGWWTFRFFSQSNKNTNPGKKLVSAVWEQKDSTVAAWDVTVEKTSGQLASGRMCARNMFLNMGDNINNGDVLKSNLYALTYDGFLYNFNFNGMDPYGFVFFANNRGLLKVDNVGDEKHYQSLMHSIYSDNNYLSDLSGMGFDPNISPATEEDETYLLFFNEPDTVVLNNLTGKDHLTNDSDLASQTLGVKFSGNREDGSTVTEDYCSTEGMGGTFTVTAPISNVATSYTIIINFKGDPLLMDTYGYTAEMENKIELSNSIKAGSSSTVIWDGCDAYGNVVPSSNDIYKSDVSNITVIAKTGETHFPLFDVENNYNGVKVTLVNENLSNLYGTPTTLHYNNDNSSLQYGSKNFADQTDMSAGLDTAKKGASAYTDKKGDQTALDFWAYYELETKMVTDVELEIIPKAEDTNTTKAALLPDGTYHGDGDFVDNGTVLTYEFSITNPNINGITYHNIIFTDTNLGVSVSTNGIKLYDENISGIIPVDYSDIYAKVENITFDESGEAQYTQVGSTHYFSDEADLKNFLLAGGFDENGTYCEIFNNQRVTIGGFKKSASFSEPMFTNTVSTTVHYTDVTGAEIPLNEYASHSVAVRPYVSDKHFVIDYGKPVTYQGKDVFDGEGEIAINDIYDKRIRLSVDNSFGSFGILKINSDRSVTYTPNKIMNSSDTFVIRVTYRYSSGVSESYTKKLTIVPANTMYYEDDFAPKNNADSSSGFVYSGSSWTTVGVTNFNSQQDSDLNGENNYGYDSSYANDSKYSNGSSHYTATASVTGNLITSTFTFYGTGFEVYSLTNMNTGIVRVIVYRGAKASGVAINYSLIDTLYKNGELYQIPVISLMDLDYGQYTVQLQVRSATSFISGGANRSDFYIDGLKIYFPIGENGEYDTNTEFNTYANHVYNEDHENDSKIVGIRSTILDADTAKGLAQNNESITGTYGAVYIDWGQYTEESPVYGQNTTVLEDYTNYGPKNEIYLLPGQAIAFRVGSGYTYDLVQIGAKSPDGTQSSIMINDTDCYIIQTSTDMYYGVTPDENGIIVVENTATPTPEEMKNNPDAGIISLTKIKVSGYSTIKEDANLLSVDCDTIMAAQACMMNFSPREIATEWSSETVEPEESAVLTVITSNDVETLSVDGNKADYETANDGSRIWSYETDFEEPGTYSVSMSAENARGIESRELQSAEIVVKAVESEPDSENNEVTSENTTTDDTVDPEFSQTISPLNNVKIFFQKLTESYMRIFEFFSKLFKS